MKIIMDIITEITKGVVIRIEEQIMFTKINTKKLTKYASFFSKKYFVFTFIVSVRSNHLYKE